MITTLNIKKLWPPFIAGLMVGGSLIYFVYPLLTEPHHHSFSQSGGWHTHADFLIVINDEPVDLTGDKYMTTTTQAPHPHAHLHDNESAILHYHAPDISLAEFLSSLAITLSPDCLELDDSAPYCTNDEQELVVFVNNEPLQKDYLTYVPADLDRILIYYGSRDSTNQQSWLGRVTDEACIYTGSCPERGLPPPESCGLTCEL